MRNRHLFILGVVVAILGAFTVAQSLYYREQDSERQRTETLMVQRTDDVVKRNSLLIACIEESFAELARVLEIRGNAVERETALTSRIWDTYTRAAGLLKGDPTRALTPAERAQFRQEAVAALLAYRAGIDEIRLDRKRNPVPPYPSGKCNKEESK